MSAGKDSKRLKWVESIAYLMDNQFKIPGTNMRFGLDPIIGLVPFLGDISTFAVSGALVLTMARHGASRAVVVRMVFNILLDLVIGSIPVLGAIFDFGYKANERNVKLLRDHYEVGKHKGTGNGFIALVVIVLLLATGLVIFGMVKIFMWAWHYLGQWW